MIRANKMMHTTFEALEPLYNLRIDQPKHGWTVEESYTFCRRLTHAHYENFPVGSILIPKKLRPHVHAIYAFARMSDDFSDEAFYEGQRMERLDEWDAMLQACYQGKADHPVFIALGQTVKELDLPMQLFRDLLTAFKMDVTTSRYQDWDQVLHYCRHSANPVGRLILHLFGYRDDILLHWSDCICTALQLANFWQDVAVDLKKDRIYIPQSDMEAFGYCEKDLINHVYDERYIKIMRKLVLRAWVLIDEGYPLLLNVPFPLSAELRFTWLGGTGILHRTALCNYNVFDHRPKLSKLDFMKLGLRSFFKLNLHRNTLRQYFSAL